MWSESDGERENEIMSTSSRGSEVVRMDERAIACASNPALPPASLQFIKSKGIHVGDQFVSVTQTVHNNEVVKDLPFPRYVWKVLKNTSTTERMSCAAALAALLTLVALIVYFTSAAKNTGDDFVDIAPHEWNITRKMWLAKTGNNTSRTQPYEPLRLVIVQHTVSTPCDRFVVCAEELRILQSYFLRNLDYDIPYNFIIGNDGRVYEGRGWGFVGAHTYGYNSCSLGLGFIGDYREEIPSHSKVTPLQMERTQMLLDEGVKRGILHPDFKIVGAKDLRVTDSPGSHLYNALRQLPYYDNDKLFYGKTCDQIHAQFQD